MTRTSTAALIVAGFALAGSGLLRAQAPPRPERHASIPVATRDGRRILFQSDRSGESQIYSMNVDGTGLQQLTRSPPSFAGDWSPDGRWIVFCSAGGADVDSVVSMRTDGSGRRTLASGKDAGWPRISPDGGKIAYGAIADDGRRRIFVMNADGSDLRAFPTGLEDAWEPAWAPDGRLLFAKKPDLADKARATTSIYVADVTGANRRLLATAPGILQIPRWSPDGRQVAYQAWTGGKDINVILIDAASGDVRAVTHQVGPIFDETPSWLPDGRLLFQSNRTGTMEIYRMNADGSGQELISH